MHRDIKLDNFGCILDPTWPSTFKVALLDMAMVQRPGLVRERAYDRDAQLLGNTQAATPELLANGCVACSSDLPALGYGLIELLCSEKSWLCELLAPARGGCSLQLLPVPAGLAVDDP